MTNATLLRETADLVERMTGGYTAEERAVRVARLRDIARALEYGQHAWQWGADLALEPVSILPPRTGVWRRVVVIEGA